MKIRTRLTIGATAALAVGMIAGPQLATAGHANAVLTADLDGRSEVADGATNHRIVGDPNGTGEAYVFGIDGDPTTLCYVVTAERIDDLDRSPAEGGVAAHIHEGAPDENGPVVANLAWPQDGESADCLTEGEPGKFTAEDPSGVVQEILQNPHDYYVNIHNRDYPGGALRGQLDEVGAHTH